MQRIVLFDGTCNLCNASVQFIIRHDAQGRFQFASLQSPTGQRLSGPDAPDSIVYLRDSTKFTQSTAALYIAKDLSGFVRLAFLCILIPRPLRDQLYDFVARHRYRWFGQRDACMMPTPEIRDRFLD